jgi:hypothetical protein
MSSWGNNDNAANAPYWAINSTISPDNPYTAQSDAANVALLYGNTTTSAFTTNETIGLFARNQAEIVASGNVYAHTGWVLETTGTGGRAGRVQREVLVALKTIVGDSFNGDYPVPNSGSWQLASAALSGITYANKGTPAAPTGGFTTFSVPTTSGLMRKKYDGNFCVANNSLPLTWDPNFFATATLLKSIPDTYLSWGQQSDGDKLGESLFSMEWKGYIQVPTTQNYNFYAESDDHIAVWIGNEAYSPTMENYLLASSNKSLPADATTTGVVNANSRTMDSTKWYPIRMIFSEFTGGCKAQLYAQGANGTKYTGDGLSLCYATSTGGYAP